MFNWSVGDRHFFIRDVEGDAEYHAIEDIQKEAWGFNDLDTVPAATLIATKHAGGSMLGAFEGDYMIGFVYAFPAIEGGRTTMHSHMLAVRPEYRSFHAGVNLKLAQREQVLENGIDEITWTFDPLQSLNANLNFAKLGVVSRQYLVDFYGEATSSPLHRGFGTDRLWVSWLLKSEHVKQRISPEPSPPSGRTAMEPEEAERVTQAALVLNEEARSRLTDFSDKLTANRCTIEIPHNIVALKEREPKLGVEWREATRTAFLAALDAGFLVDDFLRIEAAGTPRWFYSLSKQLME